MQTKYYEVWRKRLDIGHEEPLQTDIENEEDALKETLDWVRWGAERDRNWEIYIVEIEKQIIKNVVVREYRDAD